MAFFIAHKSIPPENLAKLRSAFDQLTKNRSYTRLVKNLGEDISTYQSGAEYDKTRAAKSADFKKVVDALK